jgi:hypothetical protein
VTYLDGLTKPSSQSRGSGLAGYLDRLEGKTFSSSEVFSTAAVAENEKSSVALQSDNSEVSGPLEGFIKFTFAVAALALGILTVFEYVPMPPVELLNSN